MFESLSTAMKKSRKWLVTLACIVVFVVTYALILPAITIDTDTAQRDPGISIADQENETEATTPAVSLIARLDDVVVSVDADEGVLPEGVSLKLGEAGSEDLLPALITATQSDVRDASFVEISFVDKDGAPAVPQGTCRVEIVSDTLEGDSALVRLDGDEAKLIEDTLFSYKKASFELGDAVSTIALVQTQELTADYISAEGKVYSVTVSYDATALIPEGATLSLKEIKENSKAYLEAMQTLLDAGIIEEPAPQTEGSGDEPESEKPNASASPLKPLSIGIHSFLTSGDAEETVDCGLDVLEIGILDENGKEIEPAAPVTVEITMKALPKGIEEEEFVSSMKVTHLRETGEEICAEVVAENGSGTPGKVSVEENAAVISFETDSFSYYTVTWTYTSNNRTYYRSSNIHYGYMSGGRFVEFPNGTPGNNVININSSHSPAFLIYDVPGYQFDSAHLDSATGTEIEPLIRYNNSRWQYTTPPTNGNFTSTVSWTNIANSSSTNSNQDIYMVYKAMDPVTMGGHAKLYETATDDPNDPTVLKESQNNHDGTRTLSLSVTGDTRPIEAEKLADVIVIYDVSGSMENDLNGNSTSDSSETRLAKGKTAIMSLANDLLNRKNREGGKLVRMALVTFSNVAQAIQMGSSGSYFTSEPSTYENAVDSVTSGGGTNWEMALQVANRLDVDPERETFVIFVTDGNPTWRMTRSPTDEASTDAELLKTSQDERDMYNSRTYQYYRQYNVFGQGSSDNKGKNYAAALAESVSIVEHGKHYYSIGISSDVTNLDNLMEECGAGEDHSFVTETEEELWNAIEKIRVSIEGTLGWGDVEVVDGITNLTNLIAKAPIANVDPNSFTYQKSTDGGQTWTELNLQTEGINPATYDIDSGHVEWNMGESFQLAKDTTYKVSFLVWPAQLATDIVTDLNNGTRSYESLDPEIKEQIEDQGGYYTLKTNTDEAYVNYKVSRVTGSSVTTGDEVFTLPFQTVPPLVVETMPMTLEKVFEDAFGDETGNGIGADRPSEVHLTLECRPMGSTSEDDWEPFPVTYVNPAGDTVHTSDIWLSEANNWKTTFYVSPGLRDKDEVHLNEGHEYRLTEENTEYHYELFSEYLNPYLQGHASPVTGMDPLLAAEEVYVTKEYGGDTDGSEALTAKNIVKGGINLVKHVISPGSNVDPDTEFTIRGWILDPDGNPYLFDQANDDRTDKSKKADPDTTPLFYLHQNDPLPYHFYDANGRRTVYKGHFDSTGQIEFKIKDGEQIRFPIIPSDCTYLFWEVDGDGMPTGFVLENITGVARENLDVDGDGVYEFVDSSDLSKYPVVNGDNQVGGTIVGNTLFQLDFYNRYIQPNRITVNKKLTNADGTAQIYPDKTFTVRGYIRNRFGLGYTFDPALDDRDDKSQPLPESEYDTHTWDEHQDDPIAYNIIDKDGNYVVYKGHFPNTDSISFELRSGDTLEFLNIPDNHSYQFYEDTGEMEQPDSIFEYVSSSGEAVTPDGHAVMQPSLFPNTDGYMVVAGTVRENEEHNIRFVNRIKVDVVDLRVRKVDANSPDKRLNGAQFLLYADEDHLIPATDFAGNPIGTIVTGGYADDGQTQPLGIGVIGNLLPGTYYLVETAAPDGYNAPAGHVIVTVSNDGSVSILQEDNAQPSENVIAEGNVVTFIVTNTTGKELPNTGGPGTFLYTSGGLLLMAAAMIYLICVRRRERRLE